MAAASIIGGGQSGNAKEDITHRQLVGAAALVAVLLCCGCGGLGGAVAADGVTNAGITAAGNLADAAGRKIGSIIGEKLTKGSKPSSVQPRQAPERYEPADLARLASGAFNAEYANKNVRVEAQFTNLANTYGRSFGRYAPTHWIYFNITARGYLGGGTILVIAPKSRADDILATRSGEPITVCGQVIHVREIRDGVQTASGLVLVADRIDVEGKIAAAR